MQMLLDHQHISIVTKSMRLCFPSKLQRAGFLREKCGVQSHNGLLDSGWREEEKGGAVSEQHKNYFPIFSQGHVEKEWKTFLTYIILADHFFFYF